VNKWKLALASILLLALTASFGLAQATGASGTSTSGQAATKAEKEKAEHPKLDINTATKDELTALTGIGEAYSQKIIDNRPYKAKNELVSKNVIPQATYKKIKNDIVAHQMKLQKANIKKQKTTAMKP